MKNEQKNSSVFNFLLMAVSISLMIVCVLILIIIITAEPAQNDVAVEQVSSVQVLATQTPTSTPIPTPEIQLTEEPVVTAEVTAAPTPTPTAAITPTPVVNGDVMWINISYLVIRDRAGFENEKIGNIPYGTMVIGEINDPWMYTTYNGVSGYIYVGKMDGSGRPCAVYSESELEPLD